MFFVCKKTAVYSFTAVFLILLDRALKVFALNYLATQDININSFFKLSFQKNYNIAFSLPLSGVILNVIIFIILIFLLFMIKSEIKKNNFTSAGLLVIILAGALSNFYDRCAYGFVIDYFDLKYFTVFNVADAMIVLGVIAIICLNFDFKFPSIKRGAR